MFNDENLQNEQEVAKEEPVDAGADGNATAEAETLESVIGKALSSDIEDDGNDADKAQDKDNQEPDQDQNSKAVGDQKEHPQEEIDDDLKAPENLSEKANERFRELANQVREYRNQEAEFKRVQAEYQEIQNLVQDSFDSPEEFGEFIAYAKAVKHGNFDYAEKVLREQVAQFEAYSGRSFGGGLMDNFDDLKQRVEAMEIDEATARELAAARFQQQQKQQYQQQHYAAVRQQQEYEIAHQRGIDDLNNFSLRMAKSDLMWNEIEPKLADYAKKHLKDVHPSQWVPMLESYYNGLKLSIQPVRGNVNPLRSGLGVSASAEPKTMQEAINLALNG